MSYENLKKYAELVDRMATARGVDLQEAAMRHQMTPDDISDMVLKCSGCTCSENCTKWLDQQKVTAPATPEYCRNADVFSKLAAE